jgi:hypothetical protein
LVPGAAILAPGLQSGAPISAFSPSPTAAPASGAAAAEIPNAVAAPAAPDAIPALPAAADPGGRPLATVRAGHAAPASFADGADNAARARTEDAAASGRRFFDRASDRGSLSHVEGGTRSGAAALAAAVAASRPGFGVEGEELRDAVAAFPAPAAGRALMFAAPAALRGAAARGVFFGGRAPSIPAANPASAAAAPTPIGRLLMELGPGLVLRIRAVLGLAPEAPAAAPTRSAAAAVRSGTAAPAARVARAPLASTEFLERRGLLESLSAFETAAAQNSAAQMAVETAPKGSAPASALVRAQPASGTTRAAPPRFSAHAESHLPRAWWGLAFLSVALVLVAGLL